MPPYTIQKYIVEMTLHSQVTAAQAAKKLLVDLGCPSGVFP